MLITRLEQRPEIAKGFVKEKQTEFWEKLTNDLNAAGPPEKSIKEWITVRLYIL